MNKIIFLLILFLAALICDAKELVLFKDEQLALKEIVVPDNSNSVEAYTAEELAFHIEKACGEKVQIIKESNASANGSYIYVGACAKSQAIGLNGDAMPHNSGEIFVDNDNIYIFGKDGKKGLFWHEAVSKGSLFAAYDFLRKYFGVRWIWPGELGIVVPKCKTLSVPVGKTVVKPKLLASRWRLPPSEISAWTSKENREKFIGEQTRWLIRHQFNWSNKFNRGHAFTQYFARFGKNHPEYFNLLPDGTRRSNPYNWSHGSPSTVSMCVTNNAFQEHVVAEWAAKSPRDSTINLNENDTSGDCVCENCLIADNSKISNKIRLKKATKLFEQKENDWIEELGSVSDRYCKFYLDVQKLADKIDPKHTISGLIYSNYSEPPSSKVKLNERIWLRFCPPIMYPWTQHKINNFKRIWKGWTDTGAKLMFRPNFTLDGNCFPILYQEEFYDVFMYAAKNGMIASDMDSLTGSFAAQGLTNYVIARLNHDWESSLETIEDDFYSAFGAARDTIKIYCDYLTKVTMKSKYKSPFTDKTLEGGILYLDLMTVADTLFTPEVMQKCNALLDQALETPMLDPVSKQRVEFLQNGLKNVEMMIAAQAEFQKYKAGKKNNFIDSVIELDAYRASLENTLAWNVGFLRYLENRHWPQRRQLHLEANPNVQTLKDWTILWDPENVGTRQKWFEPTFKRTGEQAIKTDSHWEKQEANAKWKAEHGSNYRGVAWYFNKFKPENPQSLNNLELAFGAIDGTATIYLNGKQIHHRPYPYQGNHDSWKEPFEVKIPDDRLTFGYNLLTIRIEKQAGLSGIFRMVVLRPRLQK